MKSHRNITIDELYYKVLEIGMECITCGIRFDELKQRLIRESYINATDSEITLITLFEESFEDRNDTCEMPGTELYEDLCTKESKDKDKKHYAYNHIKNCTHYVTSESLMNFIKLKDSKNNMKFMKTSRTISFIALAISILMFVLVFINYFNNVVITKTKEWKQLQDKINQLQTNTKLSSEHLYRLDSVHQGLLEHHNIYQVLDKKNLK